MPLPTPFKPRKMPERIKRHIALRDLAETQAADKGKTLNRTQAKARAKELEKDTLPHTADYWNTYLKPSYEPER
jgi:hypothetical protein